MPKGLSKNHAQDLKDFAATNGFEYLPSFRRSQLRADSNLSTFDGWTEGHNLLSGSFEGTDLQMFDMVKVVQGYDADGHSTESTVTQTVILFESSANMPCFSMLQLSGVFSMMGLAGSLGVTLEVDGGLPAEREVVAKFNQRYLVTGTSFEAGTAPRETPECVNLPLVQRLQSGRGWSVEAAGSHIAVLVAGKVLPTEDRLACMAESIELLNAMTSRAPSSSSTLLVRKQAPFGARTLIRMMIWPFVGGLAGILATAVVVGAVRFAFEEPPGWFPILIPIVGMPLMIIGPWAGLKFGALRNKG